MLNMTIMIIMSTMTTTMITSMIIARSTIRINIKIITRIRIAKDYYYYTDYY